MSLNEVTPQVPVSLGISADLTRAEAAAALGISVRALDRYVARRRIAYCRYGTHITFLWMYIQAFAWAQIDRLAEVAA